MIYPRSRLMQPHDMATVNTCYLMLHLRGGGCCASTPARPAQQPVAHESPGYAGYGGPQQQAVPAHAAFPFLAALDDKLEAAIASGAIKLLYADFVRSGKLKVLRRRQDLEALEAECGKKIFLTPEEAVAALRANDRRIGALTYGWSTMDHPDQTGTYLSNVRRFLRCPLGTHIVAVFWDYASLHQKPRTPAQDAFFSQALGVMGDVYASALATTVMRHRPSTRPTGCKGCVRRVRRRS